LAQLVYIDETGMDGTPGGGTQPLLTLVGVMAEEDVVQPLTQAMRDVAMEHLGWVPADLEFHGYQIWHAHGHWGPLTPAQLLAAYEAVIALLDRFDLSIAFSTIDKVRLHDRYGGKFDSSAYCLGLQFLLEKIDRLRPIKNRIVIADEAREQELRAVEMLAGLQFYGFGEVPGVTLKTVIDSLHYVSSNRSAGVQMADLVAYVIQRARRNSESHPDAAAALGRMREVVNRHTSTFRTAWPRAPH
jgi:hypothetical protein